MIGDIALGDTVTFPWPTSVDGVPTAVVGPAIGAYVGTSAAPIAGGLTFTPDVNGPGDNIITIVATGGNGYAIGQDITIKLTAGTLGGVAIATRAVEALSVQHRSVAVLATAVWGVATRRLSDGTNIVLAKGTGVTGFTDLDAAGVLAAVGLAAPNLDTQLADLPTNADLATALAAADDAVLTAIDAVPTNAELATALAAADDAVLAAIPTAAQIADKLLLRNLAGGSDGGRTVRDAMRFNRNKFTIVAGVLTVYEEDDATIAWTSVITTTAGDPVSASDPA